MGFGFKIEPGEHLILAEVFSPSRLVDSFALGVSDRAVFVAAQSRFRLGGRWTVRRIPLEDIRSVVLAAARPYMWWLLSAALFVAGSYATVDLVAPLWSNVASTVPAWFVAFLAVGGVIPFVVRTRTKLTISTGRRAYRWTPSATVNRHQRALALRIQRSFIEACRQVGISVDDTA